MAERYENSGVAGRGSLVPAALVWASTLALASVRPLSVVLLCLGVLWVVASRGRGQPVAWGSWVLLSLALWSALQCVPLPPRLVGVLSPASQQIWTDAQELVGTHGWLPLSVDPEATRFEALKFVVYAAFWGLGQRVRRRHGLKHVASIVFGLGLALALLSWLHTTAGWTRVYGVYRPAYAGHELMGPVLNPNNLSGLLNLSVFCGLGVALHRTTGDERAALTSFAVATLIAGSFLTASRGGAASLVLLLCTFGALLVKKQRHQANGTFGRRGALVVAALGSGAGLVLLASSSRTMAQLRDASLSKLQLLASSTKVALDFPLFGTGRGAFAPALPPHLEPGVEQVFTHAENWVIEAVTGWGWLGGSFAVAALLWALRPGPQLAAQSSTRTAVYCGVLVLALQNLADLGLDVVGVAVPFVFVLGALNVDRSVRDAPLEDNATWPRGPRPSPPRRLLLAWLALGRARRRYLGASCACALWLLSFPPRLAHDERRELGSMALAGELGQLRGELGEALMRHPGDAFLMRLGAAVSLADGQEDPLAWLNGSLRRDPGQPRTYLLLADALYAAGRSEQALPALRRAAEISSGLHAEVARRLERWLQSEFERAVPEGPTGAAVLVELASTTQDGALAILALESAFDRGHPDALRLLTAAWLHAAERGTPPCEAPHACLEVAAWVLSEVDLETTANDFEWALLRARWHQARDEHQAAYDLLRERCEGDARCHGLLLGVASRLSFGQLRWAADRYLAAHCGTALDCAKAEAHVGRLFERRGELRAALDHLERSANQRDDAASWLHAAAVAARAGRPSQAKRLWQRAERAASTEDDQARAAVVQAKSLLVDPSRLTAP